jgi:hypothetical protein
MTTNVTSNNKNNQTFPCQTTTFILLLWWWKRNQPHTICQYRGLQKKCFDKKNAFIDYQAFKGNEIIFIGDNTTHIICVQGQVIIKLLNGLEKTILKKFHVFELKKNLFSWK